MRKHPLLLLVSVCLLAAAGCGPQAEKGQDRFDAAVLEVSETGLLLERTEKSGPVSAGTEVRIGTETVSADGLPELSAGDRVRVVFSGLQETDPAGVDTLFAVYLLDGNGEPILPG